MCNNEGKVAELEFISFTQAIGLIGYEQEAVDARAVGTFQVGDVYHTVLVMDSGVDAGHTITFAAVVGEFEHEVVGGFFIISATNKDTGVMREFKRAGGIGENMQRQSNRAWEDRMLRIGRI